MNRRLLEKQEYEAVRAIESVKKLTLDECVFIDAFIKNCKDVNTSLEDVWYMSDAIESDEDVLNLLKEVYPK
jgi:hypothetical protein